MICFGNCQGVPFSHSQSRNRMMNTFTIVNNAPTYIYACPLQKVIPSPSRLARNRIQLGTRLKEELTDLFWKLPGYSLFTHRQSKDAQ